MSGLGPFLNRVTHGDCIEVLKRLPEASIDLILTDPPYIVRYQDRGGRKIANDDNPHWIRPAFTELYRVLKPDRYCLSFYGWGQAGRFLWAWRECGFYPVGHFVFVKSYASRTSHTRMHHEQAYLLAKGRPSPPADPPKDVLEWEYAGNRLHPTQKPVSILTPLIEAYSAPGEVVLDPFAGSGSTGIAARYTGRQFVLIEKLVEHARTARRRIEMELEHPSPRSSAPQIVLGSQRPSGRSLELAYPSFRRAGNPSRAHSSLQAAIR